MIWRETLAETFDVPCATEGALDVLLSPSKQEEWISTVARQMGGATMQAVLAREVLEADGLVREGAVWRVLLHHPCASLPCCVLVQIHQTAVLLCAMSSSFTGTA